MISSTVRWIATLAVAGAFVACASEPELTPSLEQAVRAEGSAAAQALMGTLRTNLLASMKKGGPTEAIEFCSSRALALTDSVSNSLGSGIFLKRVSERHRNPKNAPDEPELEALRFFEASLAENGDLPADWVQQTPTGELRYYKPMMIAAPCLACHGDPATMDPTVREALETTYPDDLASGYEAGDFRGLVRVSVSEERATKAMGE